MSSITTPSVAPDKLQQLLIKDKERMDVVTSAVEAALTVIQRYAQTQTELEYMRYKTALKLLLPALETFDQAMLIEGLSPEE